MIFSTLKKQNRFLASLVLAFFITTAIGPLPLDAATTITTAQEKESEVEVVADDLQYSKEERKIYANGNVVVGHQGIELSADKVWVQVDTKDSQAEGHVFVTTHGKGMIQGDQATYNFETNEGSFPNGRFYQEPWYGGGEELIQEGKRVIKAKEVHFTSCNLPHPHYDVKASSATLYPGDKIVAKNVFFRVLGVPIFWLPIVIIPLNYSPGNITPGYSDEFGGYVLVEHGFSINENVKGKLHADYYSKRGFGVGADLDYKFERMGRGQIQLYGIDDDEAPNERNDNPFEDGDTSGEKRGRFSWKHKMRLDDFTNLQFQWHELSDRLFLQDFFEGEHREEIDPQSYLTVTRNTQNYSLLANYEKRTNRFQTVGEKLPEVIFTWLRKPLFGTNFYYTNQEGYVNFNQTKSFAPSGPRTHQFFTDHELLYPMKFLDHYQFIPFVNYRHDVYTEGATKEEKISRYAVGLGFDLSTRFYNTWDIEGETLGIKYNGLRHILEPIIQYNSIKFASVEPTRLINTGHGDDIDHLDVITFGIENRIQTRQGESDNLQRIDLLSFNAYMDFSFGPGSDLIETTSNKFVEARIDATLRPYSWLQLRDSFVWNFNNTKVSTNNLELEFTKDPVRFLLDHRVNNNGSEEDRDSQLTMQGDYFVNELWTLGGYLRWEMKHGELEEWEVRARRDLHDWILAFGFNVRDSDRTDDEKDLNKEIFVELQLKALEEVRLKTGHRAEFSEPRIGRSVAGANVGPAPVDSYIPSTGNVNVTV